MSRSEEAVFCAGEDRGYGYSFRETDAVSLATVGWAEDGGTNSEGAEKGLSGTRKCQVSKPNVRERPMTNQEDA